MSWKQFITLIWVAGCAWNGFADSPEIDRQGQIQKTEHPDNPKKRKQNLSELPLPAEVWDKAQIIVGRPTDSKVDLNILAAKDADGVIVYDGKRQKVSLKGGVPSVVTISGLQLDTRYSYRLILPDGESPGYHFQTQRKPGSTFVFAVQGDSHPERGHQNDAAQYARTLLRAASDNPDFYIALGDDFSVDQQRNGITRSVVDAIYRAHRPYLSLVGNSAALFLVNGNHEQAALCNLDGTPDNVAVWAQNAREKYYSQPAPDSIYSGDMQKIGYIGFLRDYFAWEWGDALFIVLDPYWHSPQAVDNKFGSREKNRDPWGATLGKEQYDWFKKTLETSHAKYKFVFTHHVNGCGRGGVECASLYEWGGNDRKGRWLFAEKRPGWELPIHQLMAKNNVTVFFQGHDHVFSREDLDGVVYQTMPLPAGSSDSFENADAYPNGKTLRGSGYMRVTVSPEQVKLDFISNAAQKPAYSYTIKNK